MIDFSRSKLFFTLLILLLILPSCTGTKSQTSKSPEGKTPQASVQTSHLAQQSIEVGEHRKAIDIYSNEVKKQPKDPQLIKEFAKSLEDMKSSADRAAEKGDFAFAGHIYYVMHSNYTKFSSVASRLSFDPVSLNTKLAHCRKSLSTQGFQEYRQGNLNKAIAIWQSLLLIDPNNKDIKEVLRTAILQQKNLTEKK